MWSIGQLDLTFQQVKIEFKGVKTQPWPKKPTNPPDVDPILAQIEAPVGPWQVSDSKNRSRQVKWQVCFSKTQATQTRPELYKKSGKKN